MKTITLDAQVIEAISGNYDEALRLIEDRYHVRLVARGTDVTVSHDGGGAAGAASGARADAPPDGNVERVADLLGQLGALHQRGVRLSRRELRAAVDLKQRAPDADLVDHFVDARIRASSRKTIVPKSENQRAYIAAIRRNDLVFAIGPAGTGKTYLAVAAAVEMLNEGRVKRIVLARPAVEAGESLGFLPGDLAAKVDPYLRPLYDALFDMIEPDRTARLVEQGTIEIAPLAFMRGRTLDHSFMILDEAQNTTSEQMKMYLTRIGNDSKAVVTGDVTQIDLPANKVSGLVEAERILGGVADIEFRRFDEHDVVRHPLVQRIIVAYDSSRNGGGAT